MADMKTLTINGTTYNVVDETARDSVQNANDKIEKFEGYFVTLPEGYTQVEYIESTGTQYIDTLFYPSGNALRIKLNFMYLRDYSALSLFGNSTGAEVIPP